MVALRALAPRGASHVARRPEAMTLATATPDGRPSARVVLLRGMDDRGHHVLHQPRLAEGRGAAREPACRRSSCTGGSSDGRCASRAASRRSTRAESEEYWETRPRPSRIAAWASAAVAPARQGATSSRPRYAEADAALPGSDVPLPPFWGGYRVVTRRGRVLAAPRRAACTTGSATSARATGGGASGSRPSAVLRGGVERAVRVHAWAFQSR